MILWCGGEDVDFPNGGTATVNTLNIRAGYARASISGNSATIRSLAFPGGPVTSCWWTFFLGLNVGTTSTLIAGLVKDPTSNAGLWISTAAAAAGKLSLATYDGATRVQLAAESGTSIGTTLHRIDVQLLNYGPAATVNVYVDFALVLSFSGDVTVSGVTSLSAFAISNATSRISECIVSDRDTRALTGMVTLALTGAGSTNLWTNPTFSNINGTALSDLNPTSSNATGQDNEYNVTDPPAATYDIKMVKSCMRAAVSSTPAVTRIRMGYLSGGSVAFGTGATKTPGTVYGTFEQFDAVNPVTGSPWVTSDITALQLDFQSLT